MLLLCPKLWLQSGYIDKTTITCEILINWLLKYMNTLTKPPLQVKV